MAQTKSIIAPADFGSVPTADCTCGHVACVCNINTRHKSDCKFLMAATSAVGIECNHGYDVCPICDLCTCGVPNNYDNTVNSV